MSEAVPLAYHTKRNVCFRLPWLLSLLYLFSSRGRFLLRIIPRGMAALGVESVVLIFFRGRFLLRIIPRGMAALDCMLWLMMFP